MDEEFVYNCLLTYKTDLSVLGYSGLCSFGMMGFRIFDTKTNRAISVKVTYKRKIIDKHQLWRDFHDAIDQLQEGLINNEEQFNDSTMEI